MPSRAADCCRIRRWDDEGGRAGENCVLDDVLHILNYVALMIPWWGTFGRAVAGPGQRFGTNLHWYLRR